MGRPERAASSSRRSRAPGSERARAAEVKARVSYRPTPLHGFSRRARAAACSRKRQVSLALRSPALVRIPALAEAYHFGAFRCIRCDLGTRCCRGAHVHGPRTSPPTTSEGLDIRSLSQGSDPHAPGRLIRVTALRCRIRMLRNGRRGSPCRPPSFGRSRQPFAGVEALQPGAVRSLSNPLCVDAGKSALHAEKSDFSGVAIFNQAADKSVYSVMPVAVGRSSSEAHTSSVVGREISRLSSEAERRHGP